MTFLLFFFKFIQINILIYSVKLTASMQTLFLTAIVIKNNYYLDNQPEAKD